MAVFRIEKTRDYTVMSNYHLRDMSLSLKAKGLLSLMLSLPENWDYTMKGLARICKDGIDSISGGIRELEAHGYLIRARVRGANGQLGSIEYTILEEPRAVRLFRNLPSVVICLNRAVILCPPRRIGQVLNVVADCENHLVGALGSCFLHSPN